MTKTNDLKRVGLIRSELNAIILPEAATERLGKPGATKRVQDGHLIVEAPNHPVMRVNLTDLTVEEDRE